MEDEITITRGSLIAALRKWGDESQAGDWPQRADDRRFADTADYLIGMMRADRG